MSNRTVRKTIRFAPDEIDTIERLSESHGLKGSTDFIRASLLIALALPSQIERFSFGFDEVRTQLRGAASNLNQLARKANSGDIKGWTPKEQQKLDETTAAIAALHSVIASYNKIALQRQLVDRAKYRADYDALMAETSKALG